MTVKWQLVTLMCKTPFSRLFNLYQPRYTGHSH